MAMRDIAAGVGFGVICLGACTGCYYYMGETARAEIQRTLDEEKKETKKQVKKLASAKDAEEMRKALAKIVVFPKIDKIEVPDLKHAAQEEHDLIGELFTSLDDSGNGELDFGEVAEFVRDLTKAMMATKSGLDKKRVTQSGKATPNCLSKSERVLIAPIVSTVMAGADVGGKLNGELDLEEFTLLMTFLKVALCKGHVRLQRLGLEGKVLTSAKWTELLKLMCKAHETNKTHYGDRAASETEKDESSGDDDSEASSDEEEDSDSDDKASSDEEEEEDSDSD